jgi:CBS domain containing-hemolysin-like protein
VCSAFFSGSETALTALSGPQAQKLVEQHDAHYLVPWIERPLEVLTSILIGNNIFNITASALATDLAHQLLAGTSSEEWAIPAAVGVMTFLLLTFGEITPKAIAKRMYERLSRPAMWLLRLPILLFTPFTWFFSHLTRVIMRALGEEYETTPPYVTSEEIEYMIDLGSRAGSLSEDRERLLRSAFDFTDTAVREVMVARTEMVTLSEDLELDEIVDTLIDCGHSRIPVYRETVDDIVGIFYAKDLLAMMNEADRHFSMETFLREPYFVPESKQIAELLAEFQRERTHMAIVVDEFGGTAGLITLEDIIEEIFGEIQDEHDSEPYELRVIDSDTVHADARVELGEVEDIFDMEFPDHPDYETLGGFLMAQSGSVPSPGEESHLDDLRFRVVEADAKRVVSVEVQRMPDADVSLDIPSADTSSEAHLDEDDAPTTSSSVDATAPR